MSSAHTGDVTASLRCEVLVMGSEPGISGVSAFLAEPGRDGDAGHAWAAWNLRRRDVCGDVEVSAT